MQIALMLLSVCHKEYKIDVPGNAMQFGPRNLPVTVHAIIIAQISLSTHNRVYFNG